MLLLYKVYPQDPSAGQRPGVGRSSGDPADELILLQNSQPSWAIKQAKWGIMHRLETCIQAKYGTSQSSSSCLRCWVAAFLCCADTNPISVALAGSRYELGLFGSTAYGLDTNDTDLDICVVVST